MALFQLKQKTKEIMSEPNCCVVDQSHHKCVDLAYDDSGCGKLHECCAGIHDAGLHAKCLSRVRECRKLGNAWDPIRRLKPMNSYPLYTDAPGYTTQGHLVLENFQGEGLTVTCIAKSMVCGLFVGLLIKYLFKTEISSQRIVAVSVIAALLQCMLKSL